MFANFQRHDTPFHCESELRTETAKLSLIGHREENQDRVDIVERDDCVFAVVIDGMGGHEAGAAAAEAAVQSMTNDFSAADLPLDDPAEFLREAIFKAHETLVELGAEVPVAARPRATCAAALIQGDQAIWAHVGDSRIYRIREHQVVDRTRDHSHIEILLQEGLITEAEYREHPLRNYVEYCLGGEPERPNLDISEEKALLQGDVLLLCSDGLWSGADDTTIGDCFPSAYSDLDLQSNLNELLEHAVETSAPSSDNTTAAVIHWQGADDSDNPPGG